MPNLINSFYEFGEFRLDPQNRVLRRRQEVIPLTPKAFDVLWLLAGKEGQVVTKDELMRSVWSDSFVEESNLTQTVFMLRKALQESPGERYILTVQGRGYRFAAPVKEIPRGERKDAEELASRQPIGTDAADSASVSAVSRPDSGPLPGKRFPSYAWMWPAATITVLLIAGSWGYLHKPSWPSRTHTAPGRIMLAVLPFKNLTGDPTQEYFSDGLTEEMITRLGNLDPAHLGMIARTSIMHYKDTTTALDQIGRELGVQYVLEGSVRREGAQVRVTAQLVQIKDQSHLWSRQYDRDLSHLLALQGEIAQEIADEIELTLSETKKPADIPRRTSSTQSYEAYDSYLRGRYFWNKRTVDGFRQGIEYFQKAINEDPNFAPAYAGLADTYALISTYGLARPAEYMPKARAAAVRSLALDETEAEAHASLAVIAESYDYDWVTAEKEYRRAIQLNPNYATAHQWYAEYLAFQGRFDEALKESDIALGLDPLSLIIASDRGVILYFSRHYDQAIEQFHAVQELDPNFPRARMVIFAYVEKGQYANAISEIEKWRRTDSNPWSWALEADIEGRAGHMTQARRALARMEEEMNRQQHMDPTVMSTVAYLAVHDYDKALASLESAYSERSNALTALKVDPVYDAVRGEPRFQALMHQVGLAQ
ncbi:MAG TPA: winged helix-turn-helix domain-containing protein [Terriglobales bacterium]|nr:winged helix-turn-helix domain-containing protein [Terriglobales bacterium]